MGIWNGHHVTEACGHHAKYPVLAGWCCRVSAVNICEIDVMI